jgi:hypothetical protein
MSLWDGTHRLVNRLVNRRRLEEEATEEEDVEKGRGAVGCVDEKKTSYCTQYLMDKLEELHVVMKSVVGERFFINREKHKTTKLVFSYIDDVSDVAEEIINDKDLQRMWMLLYVCIPLLRNKVHPKLERMIIRNIAYGDSYNDEYPEPSKRWRGE